MSARGRIVDTRWRCGCKVGILAEPLRMLRSLRLPENFSVCELGDQWITCTDPHVLAREFYEKELRCGRYEAIDGNARGTITADLNKPLRPWPGKFHLVTDFGTGEHVFNQYQVWKTVHDLTMLGGYIVFDRPTQGYGEHCFYNTNECLIRDLAAANNYEILALSGESTKRGELIRGVLRRMDHKKFHIPQQGRYKKLLRPITTEQVPR